MKHTAAQFSICLFVVAVFNTLCFGQVATGNQPFNSYGGGPFDSVNLGNLNVHLAIPILHKAGRGLPFIYDLSYDSSIWTPVISGSSKAWQPVTNYGWVSPYGGSTGYMTNSQSQTFCTDTFGHRTGTITFVNSWVYHDQWGIAHPMTGPSLVQYSNTAPGCTGTSVTTGTGSATDGSGLIWNVGVSPNGIVTPSGQVISPAGSPPTGPVATTKTDANGNQISENSSGVITDTLGQTALTIGGTNPVTFQYTPPNGTPVSYKLNYSPFTIKTNFGCSGVAEFTATNVSLVTSISLPDGTSYSFIYEPTPGFTGDVTGRLKQITLPTGGTIVYSYTGANNGIVCADGSAAGLTRTLTPGGQWTYTRTNVSGNHWQTKVSTPPDPQNTNSASNDTVIDFQEDSATSTNTNSFYEVQRQSYQASQGSGTLLVTTNTCWNGTTSSCTTTAVSSPITQQAVTLQYPNNLQSKTVTSYNGSLITSVVQYAFATGTPTTILQQRLISYAVLGNGIVDHPSAISIADGSGTVVASTNINYDETAVTSTGTLPQHIAISGSRGNPTSLITSKTSTTSLVRRFTYFDTGTLASSTDAGTSTSGGPNLTTYSYAGSSCNDGFPTSVSEPLSMSRSFTWDCTGGVMTSITDENGKTASVLFTQTGNPLGTPDADFWRPFGATDQLSNGTSFTYPSGTASESSMLFNSGRSVVDHRATLDGFARHIMAQTLQAPGGTTYDSVQTSYDIFGRVSEVFRPYSAAKDTACSGTCPGTVTTYDALNRPFTVTDGGNGKIAYSYTANDVLQTISPAPTGEHTKQKQLEYDSLGRLISVCEITSVSGSGACGQTNSATGFLTKYTYDAQGDLIGVSQNAQPGAATTQTRTYTFDMAGRLLTENNPETGGITNIYDSWDSACGTYTSAGDLVEKKDAVGNVTCIKYDAQHRPTDITYPSGSYASVTDPKHFVYDAATVNGVAVTNAKTRLAEAYTGTAASKKTDEGFSYDARGQMIDVYESTPNSGGYYHVNATYWANGKLDVLNGGSTPLPGLPAITYGASDGSGLDGEGRITKVNAATGQNPVTSVGYNVSQQVTGVTFGSADSDSYQYDGNTGRMTKYTFNMGTGPTTQVGTLTWNANGTLGTLQIADQINSANSQTCTFAYDDLVRITSANCGTVWSQTFGLDPFGNLTKTGSGQFLPMYNMAKNQYSSIPGGSTTAYDANGNLKNDVTHSYTWDADGNMLSTDGTTVTMIYDALDRMIEQTRSSGHTQIVYGPYGLKLALMNGQTVVNAFVKLPGGARAVYNSSGLAYYRHSDHLGSSRLATTPSRTKQYDVAYAPYGEDYNGSGTQDLAFTDQNQDTVKGGWSTNLYDFMDRGYRTAHGRWTSPDPTGLLAVDPASPQSWNRYAYVVNNPLALVDLLGDDGCYDGNGMQVNTAPELCGAAGGMWLGNGMFVDSNGNIMAPGGFSFSGWSAGEGGMIYVGNSGTCYGDCVANYTQNPAQNLGSISNLFATNDPTNSDEAAVVEEPGHPGPSVDQRVADSNAGSLSLAVNKTGVQNLKNPCTTIGWVVTSAIVGGTGAAVASREAILDWALSNAPAVANQQLSNLFWRGLRPGAGAFTAAKMIGKTAWAGTKAACNAMQEQ